MKVRRGGDKQSEPAADASNVEGEQLPEKPAFLGADFPALRETLRTLAPELFEQAAPKKDGYVKEAPPMLFSANDEETTASSPRPRPLTGTPSHRLRAELASKKEAPPPPRVACEDKECDPMEVEPLDYEVQDELEDVAEEDELDDAERQVFQDYYFDLVADQYKDNMEAFMRDNQGRLHNRGEDLWHERYRYDAHMRQDVDEGSENLRNEAADRGAAERSAEARRIADEQAARAKADALRAADEAAARLAAERNRR